jgi:hypothetical protein
MTDKGMFEINMKYQYIKGLMSKGISFKMLPVSITVPLKYKHNLYRNLNLIFQLE